MSATDRKRAGKVRVAYVITELDVGGAERCLTSLATGLDRRRFEPAVYALGLQPPPDRDALLRELQAAEVPVQLLRVRSVFRITGAVRRLARLLGQQQPQVLHSFLYHANVVGCLAGRRANVPSIVTSVRVADPSRWRAYVEWLVTAQRADRIVCVSRAVAARLKAAGFSEAKLAVIPNALDAREFADCPRMDLAPFGIGGMEKVIATVGRLEKQKGLDWLLDLLPQVFQACPPCCLLVVGQGPWRGRLQRQARALGIADRVHFAGWQPDVGRLLASCDLFVLPSRWEGMPNALMEAMAAGLPVVATRVEGVDEVLGPLAGPQTAAFGDSHNFTARILQFLRDPQLAEATGQRNRQRIADSFTLPRMISAYEQLYFSLVERD